MFADWCHVIVTYGIFVCVCSYSTKLLRCMGDLSCFQPFLQRGTTFVISCLPPCRTKPLQRGPTCKGKSKEQILFAPCSFLYMKALLDDPHLEGRQKRKLQSCFP